MLGKLAGCAIGDVILDQQDGRAIRQAPIAIGVEIGLFVPAPQALLLKIEGALDRTDRVRLDAVKEQVVRIRDILIGGQFELQSSLDQIRFRRMVI